LNPQDLDISSLLEGVQHAVLVVDASTGKIVLWNAMAREIFGYSSAEVLGMNVEELVPGHLKARYRAEMSRYRETGHASYVDSGTTLDLPAVQKGGNEIHVELTLSVMELGRDMGAQDKFVLAIVRDVTESNRTEVEVRQLNEELEERVTATNAELRESEERFRLLVESLRDYATFIVDPDAHITGWNVGAERVFGYREEEIVDEDFSIVFTPEDARRGVPERELKQAVAEGRAEDERWYVRKDGSRFWGSGIVAPIRDEADNLLNFTKVVRDLTERKRAEEEIETRTHQQALVVQLGLRALANDDLQSLMDDAVALVAETLEVEYCKIVEILPGDEELLLRAGVGWKEGVVGNATESADLDSQAGYTLLSEEPVILEDLRTETRFHPPPLLREHGVVSGMTVVIAGRDGPFGVLGAHTRSRRRFTEDDINFLQAVANVLAMAIEGKMTQESLHEIREAERSRIARDLHDEALRDLTDAQMEAQHLHSFAEDPEPTRRLGRLVAVLKRVGQQLRSAIFDLRLEGEQDRLFHESLESLVELHRSVAPESDIALEVGDGVLSRPLGPTGRELLRILGEALTNARRHSGAHKVRVGVWTSEEKLIAEVEDDGRGFSPVEEPSAITAGMGTGGMRERARALGGELKIESQPGQGTKVRFEMALHEEPEEAEVPQEEEVGAVHILLVDDHASFREALATVFEREAGFAVVGQAGSLAEARRILQARGAQPVDVAVVDLVLPDGYGGDLIKELRETSPHAQALVLSAILDRAETARAVESGAAGILHKSVGMDEVTDAVRRLRAGETLLPLDEVVELLRFASSRKDEAFEARQAKTLLTAREKEVLQALAEGLDSQEIAKRLQISVKTERNHMSSIMAKLRVHSRLQALVVALRYGIVEIR
jgi:PAS domain S-box-containing protein